MKISELAKQVGVSVDTVRRWERDGLAPKPKRDVKGWRTYTQSDVHALRKVLTRLHFETSNVGKRAP